MASNAVPGLAAPQLLRSLHAGMLLLADRNFGAGTLLAQIAGTGADFLVRVKFGVERGVERSRRGGLVALRGL